MDHVYDEEWCDNCGNRAADCSCCYRCGATSWVMCTCCRECHGSGQVVLMDFEIGVDGSDYGPCPKCGGDGGS
jgi:hypothetical protein